ncbi:hypothetical protein [Sulfurimonas sp. C5]|uniref:type II restriction enzyme n=1 Tax=Sulfurimonas sp. C5 TaxID=3036947 RepID=UPI0024569D63|nr:hypothetical protein [Sulfurimonas sp. C5]MDH4945416.1 hypothetical protein [Sulfurimonas sp. C5]
MHKVSNNEAWEHIFDDLKILGSIEKNGFFDISAEEIKKRDGKEARLMTKVDHKEHLPKVMQENSLSILAIQNGMYRIAKTDPFIYIQQEPQCKIRVIQQPKDLLSIDPLNLKSESAALDIAMVSGMMDEVFQEETQLTIRGRLRGELSFTLNGITYDVEGVQIEVDGGYEGQSTVNLVEAKIGYRNNINIRQLLYPELFWKKQLQGQRKEIKSFIFYYQDDIFRFIPFYYDGNTSRVLDAEEKAFRFERKSSFTLNDLEENSKILVDRDIPFPQANDFEKVHAVFLKIANTQHPTKMEVMGEFDIVARQYDYYLNVLKWMGVCTEFQGELCLTERGEYLLSLNIEKRLEEFVRIIFSEPICFAQLKGKKQNENDFESYGLQGTTIERRLQTVRSWIKYFNRFFIKGVPKQGTLF